MYHVYKEIFRRPRADCGIPPVASVAGCGRKPC